MTCKDTGGILGRMDQNPLLLLFGLALYGLPTIVALYRGMTNTGSVFVVNLFLGWTVIGWIVALAMAAGTAPHRRHTP